MDITLFGGEGFIGQNLVERLKDSHTCHSLARKHSRFHGNNETFVKFNPYLQLWNNKSDVYIHLIDNKEYDEAVLAESIAPHSRLILFSSAIVYANPQSEYGTRKIKIESFYEDYCKNNAIDLTILRLFNVYGYYQIPFRQGSLIANILYNHINGVPTKINNLQVTRDFIFASDVARMVEKVIENKMVSTYDLATGKMYSIGELLEVISRSIGENIEVTVNNGDDVSGPGAKRVISSVALKEFETAIRKTFCFYKKHNDLIKEIIKL